MSALVRSNTRIETNLDTNTNSNNLYRQHPAPAYRFHHRDHHHHFHGAFHYTFSHAHDFFRRAAGESSARATAKLLGEPATKLALERYWLYVP